MERYLGIAVPPQLVPSLPAGTIVELRYKGDAALEPLISQVAQDYGGASTCCMRMEYFGSQAIGILIVLVSGAREPLLQALNTLRTHVFSYRELDRGQLVVAAEAADNQEA
ncbi:MAG: NIL domain-containing protein [Bifidobacterium pseudocatenulatum]